MARFPQVDWVAVNGRDTPFTKPQHYKKGSKTDTELTGHDNPLPVAGYGMTEGGLWIPRRVDDKGRTLTQLTGSNVEEVYAFDSEVITDSRVLSPTIIIESFRKISFLIVNTTEVTLDLSIFVGGDSLKLGSSKIYDGSNFMDKTIEIPNERNRLFFDISAFNINAVDGLPYSLRFGATPQKTVEVGSLSMVILGGK